MSIKSSNQYLYSWKENIDQESSGRMQGAKLLLVLH